MRPTLQRRVAIRASVINETVLRMGALNVEDVPTVRDSALQTALAELCCCALPRGPPPVPGVAGGGEGAPARPGGPRRRPARGGRGRRGPAGGVDSLTLPEAQASLATALCDARLCGTELFRTFLGRRRLRGYLGLLRSSGPPAPASCPAPRPPPATAARRAERWRAGEGSGAEDVEALAESATAFLEAFTTSAVRMDPHLFDLEEGPALQLATRVGEFAQPFERTGRGTWAKAAYLRALALRLFEHRHEAVHAYYQAWAALRGAQLVPCPLEARLIPDLADLLFETFRHREAFHVAQAGYELGGDPEAAALSRYRLEMTLSAVRRWKGDAGAAERHAARAVEVAEALGPGYRRARPRPLPPPSSSAVTGGRAGGRAQAAARTTALRAHDPRRPPHVPETTRDRLVRVTGAMVALEEGADGADPDPCLPDLDQPSCLRYSLAFNPPSLLINGSKAYAVAAQHSEGARASVVSAHVFYNLGEYHLLAGDLASATKAFEKCAAVYGGRYAHSFPSRSPRPRPPPPPLPAPWEGLRRGQHPRRRRVVEVLAQLRRGEEPASRYAPFAAARATASPEPSPTGSPHSDPPPPRPRPAAGPALPDPALTRPRRMPCRGLRPAASLAAARAEGPAPAQPPCEQTPPQGQGGCGGEAECGGGAPAPWRPRDAAGAARADAGAAGAARGCGAVVQCVNVQPAQQLLAALWRRPEEPPEPDPRP
eukprot:tig00021591_g22804.t1